MTYYLNFLPNAAGSRVPWLRSGHLAIIRKGVMRAQPLVCAVWLIQQQPNILYAYYDVLYAYYNIPYAYYNVL